MPDKVLGKPHFGSCTWQCMHCHTSVHLLRRLVSRPECNCKCQLHRKKVKILSQTLVHGKRENLDYSFKIPRHASSFQLGRSQHFAAKEEHNKRPSALHLSFWLCNILHSYELNCIGFTEFVKKEASSASLAFFRPSIAAYMDFQLDWQHKAWGWWDCQC